MTGSSARRRPRAIALLSAAIVAAAGLGTTLVSGAGSDGASVAIPADRVGEQVQFPVDRMVPPHHTVLISDSALAGLEWYDPWHDILERLTGTIWVPELGVCRRLVATSCQVRGYPRPLTLAVQLDHLPISPGEYDLLVVATGYNDSAARFESDLDHVIATARRVGFEHVAWLTYRIESGGTRGANYAALNSILNDVVAGDAYPEMVVWDYAGYTAGRDAWFISDEIHLNPTGAGAVADWLSVMARSVDVD